MRFLLNIFLIIFFVTCSNVNGQVRQLLPDLDGGKNYLLISSKKKLFEDAYKFKVITNFNQTTKEGSKSAISEYSINCLMDRVGYLDWRAYSKPWAKGKLISHDSTRHFEQVEGDLKTLEMLEILCR